MALQQQNSPSPNTSVERLRNVEMSLEALRNVIKNNPGLFAKTLFLRSFLYDFPSFLKLCSSRVMIIVSVWQVSGMYATFPLSWSCTAKGCLNCALTCQSVAEKSQCCRSVWTVLSLQRFRLLVLVQALRFSASVISSCCFRCFESTVVPRCNSTRSRYLLQWNSDAKINK